MTRKTPQATLDYCVVLYQSGLNAAQVSRKIGINDGIITRELKRLNIPIRPKTVVDEAAVCLAYTAGTSENAVAKQFGIQRAGVSRILSKHSIPRRGQSDAERAKWANMTADQRAAQVSKAHTAARGRVQAFDVLCRMAATRERNQTCQTSPYEAELIKLLIERGVVGVRQKAIGPYNCDFASSPVAVEIWGGWYHWYGPHRSRCDDRFRYIMNQGWNILAVAINSREPVTPALADYVAAYIEQTRSNPPPVCEYRVVWGAGDFSTGGCLNDNHFSIEPPFTSTRDSATGQYRRITRET